MMPIPFNSCDWHVGRKLMTYPGSILNEDNEIQIEIAERVRKRNRAYYANAKLKIKITEKKYKK
jgi:hypothetical protein